jgi:N-acetylglucosaminyldiphosphoundecaprenol N-acetyl-beta-D-mannosaminyltransferase
MRKSLIMLSVPVDDLTMDRALNRMEEFIASGRASGRSHQVATVNADFVVNALHDPELRHILQASDMATADGMPLVWGARLLGVPLTERVTGADMVPAIAERAAARGYSLYLLGAAPGVAARAGEILQERYPGLTIAGVDSPPRGSILETDRAVLDRIKAAKPDILLVAFGNPKQEKWISMYARELGVPLSIGIGGTLDLIAGVTRRAPRWMQRSGCEWLYRMAQEPQRLWKRYVRDMFYFGYFFVGQFWIMRTGRPPAAPEPPAATLPEMEREPTGMLAEATILSIQGRMDVSNYAPFVQHAGQMLQSDPFLVIDMAQAEFLDSSALGALVTLTNQARKAGGELWLVHVPPAIRRILEMLKLDLFFDIQADVPAALAARQERARPMAEPTQTYAGWTVVKTPRMLDTAAAHRLATTCQEHMEESPRLIINLEETLLLSSTGLAVLMSLNQQSGSQGGAVRITGCSQEVLHSLQQVGLDTVLPVFANVQAAATA